MISYADDNRIDRIWLTPKGKTLMGKLNITALRHETCPVASFSKK
jgi:hypothetical protein